jgi:hypothetical protein
VGGAGQAGIAKEEVEALQPAVEKLLPEGYGLEVRREQRDPYRWRSAGGFSGVTFYLKGEEAYSKREGKRKPCVYITFMPAGYDGKPVPFSEQGTDQVLLGNAKFLGWRGGLRVYACRDFGYGLPESGSLSENSLREGLGIRREREESSGPRAEQVGSDPTSREPFTCTASAGQSVFAPGTPVVVRVSLHNGLGRAVQIRDYPWHHPFFSFDVQGPDGRTVPLTGQFPTPGGSSPEEWKSLPAGGTYTVEIDVARWHDLSKPGTYEITARWCLRAMQAPYERAAKPIRIEIRAQERQRSIKPDAPAEAGKAR